MAHDVAVEGLREGVFHPVLQAHHSGLLGDHVHDDIGGQALGAVGEPLDEVGIGDGGDPDGAALVVDLGGVVGVFKLADHVAEGAHLAVAQEVGGVLVQGGDLTKGNLGDVLGEIAILHGEQIPVGRGAERGIERMEPTMATAIRARNRMPTGRHWVLMKRRYSLGPPPLLTTFMPEVIRALTTYTTHRMPMKV